MVVKRGYPSRGCLLTLRDRQIIALVAEGLRNQQIADKLGLSKVDDVKIHLHRIYEKLGVDSRVELLRYALRYGLVPFMIDKQGPVSRTEQQRIERGMRCVTLLAHILPDPDREEWLGELRETRWDLTQAGYSRWGISFITWMWVLRLGWTLIKGFNFSKKKQQGSS
jgi:DNA-binding CsgD family transcriptional regulator